MLQVWMPIHATSMDAYRAVPDHEFTGFRILVWMPDPDTGYRIPDSDIRI